MASPIDAALVLLKQLEGGTPPTNAIAAGHPPKLITCPTCGGAGKINTLFHDDPVKYGIIQSDEEWPPRLRG